MRPPQPLWRNRDYLILWLGQTVSVAGTSVSTIAFPLLVLALTGSSAQAGLLVALERFPFVAIGLLAGTMADRWDRRRVMILSDLGRALALGSIPIAAWAGRLSMAQLYVVALTEGTLFTFFNICQGASLPRVVAKEQLTRAAAQAELSWSVADVAGPSIAGVLFQSIGHSVPFLADAFSYLASVISLAFMRTNFQEERASKDFDLRREIQEGVAWLWSHSILRFLALFSGIINFIVAGAVLIAIVIARGMGASPSLIGLTLSAASIGAVLGSVFASYVPSTLRFGRFLVAWSLAACAIWPLLAVAPNLLALGLVAAGLSFLGPIYWATQYGYRASLVPDEFQGRVNSVYRITAFSGIPLGTGASGLLLQRFGPRPTVFLLWIGFLLVALATGLNPRIRSANYGR